MTDVKKFLIDKYNELAFTHSYILGYSQKGMIYGAIIEDGRGILPYILKVSKIASKRGESYNLRYFPNSEIIQIINMSATKIFPVMSTARMEEKFATEKGNRGNIFEDAVAEILKAEQPQNKCAKFTETGDIIKNGKHYQVKYAKATLTDERTLENLNRRG